MGAKICLMISEKGGAGKSTATFCLGSTLASRGASVLGVDLDPQGSLTGWANSGGASVFPVVASTIDALPALVKQQAPNYQYIFIDPQPRADDVSARLIALADLALVVVQPSPFDAWAASTTADLLEARMKRGGFEVGILLNRIHENRNLARSIRDGQWHTTSLPILDNALPEKELFKAMGAGGNPYLEPDLKPYLDALADEIFGE